MDGHSSDEDPRPRVTERCRRSVFLKCAYGIADFGSNKNGNTSDHTAASRVPGQDNGAAAPSRPAKGLKFSGAVAETLRTGGFLPVFHPNVRCAREVG